MKKILFSPVGGTDPISNFRDGALLHICRVYRPDVIYLYLSKEMCDFQAKDDRYRYCLKKMEEKLNCKFEIHEIQKEELVDVQIFDTFIKEFREILSDLHSKYVNDQLILNVSSGTPAMKSALQILAAIGEVKVTPVQVSTPEKRINPHDEDRENYDVREYWELNEDNIPERLENRCKESENYYLLDEIRKESMIKHIRAYDYVAALKTAEELTEPVCEEAIALIQAAACRLKLNINEVNGILKPYQLDIIPVRREETRRIFEYILNLEIKVKKQEYADFLRAITPIVVEMFKIALDKCSDISWKEYCSKDSNGQWKWDQKKLSGNLRIKKALDCAFGGCFKAGPVYSSNLKPLILEYVQDEELLELTKKINAIESTVRNLTAHEIIAVTARWVKNNSVPKLKKGKASNKNVQGYYPEEIYQLIKRYAEKLELGIKKEDWNSYDDMNELIIRKIKQ